MKDQKTDNIEECMLILKAQYLPKCAKNPIYLVALILA